jgi:hypothetical protein
LGELFLEADRVGRKYQSQAEIDAFNQAHSKANNEIDDLIDELYPDGAKPEAIGYKKLENKQGKTTKRPVPKGAKGAFDKFMNKANQKKPENK